MITALLILLRKVKVDKVANFTSMYGHTYNVSC